MGAVIGFIAKPMGQLLLFFYNLVGDYGLAIILFTVIIKALMYPLTHQQMRSQKGMQDLQPKINDIKKKHANNKELMNQKIMELYQEEKINPMGGCLPLIIQLPIIYGLFALLRTPGEYIQDPAILSALNDSFLWVSNLSEPDVIVVGGIVIPWIFPILSAIATFLSFRMTSSSTDNQPAMMKNMQYIFPLMILWMGRSFPAGLTLYWFVSTLFQIVQQTIINRVKTAKEGAK